MVLQSRLICFSIRDSKIEGVPTKLLGRATLSGQYLTMPVYFGVQYR